MRPRGTCFQWPTHEPEPLPLPELPPPRDPEPPLLLPFSVFFAIRDALKAARGEFGETSVLALQSPATPERIRISCADPILKRAWVEPEEGEKSWFISI